jgi:aminoglycoside phosphotransferase (APT) family kinase protein
LSIGQKKKILFLLGKYAKKMHSVKVKGFGYIKQAGKGIDRSWKVFLGEDGDGILEEVRKKHIVERKLLEGMERSWESGKGKYLDIKQGVLLHGDLADDNVMVEHGELSGIIDTDALSGDPYYDLGMVYEGFFDKPLVDAFFRGYGKVDLERVRFYAIYYLGWLCILHQKEKRKLDVVKRKLRKILEEGLK